MTPGEIRACYQLYAAHRKSHEICAFPRAIPATSNTEDSDDLAILLRLHIGLERLASDIGHGDPNDDLRPALAKPVEWDNPYDVGMTGLIGFSSGYYAMFDCDVSD
jgi:hypothetical protein